MATLFWWPLWKSLSGQLGSVASLALVLVWCNKVPQTRCFNTTEMNYITVLEASGLPSGVSRAMLPLPTRVSSNPWRSLACPSMFLIPVFLHHLMDVFPLYVYLHIMFSSLCVSISRYLFLLLYKHQLYWIKSSPYSNMTLSWLVTTAMALFQNSHILSFWEEH